MLPGSPVAEAAALTHQLAMQPARSTTLSRIPPAPTPQVLQDGDKRAAYDRQLALAAAAAHVHINETVPLAELAEEAVDGLPCRAWPCRCGGGYYLLDEDAQAAQAAAAADAAQAAAAGAAEARPAELVVPCSTCSLHIRVLAPPA